MSFFLSRRRFLPPGVGPEGVIGCALGSGVSSSAGGGVSPAGGGVAPAGGVVDPAGGVIGCVFLVATVENQLFYIFISIYKTSKIRLIVRSLH